jgi:hypothetical protein
MKWPLTSQILAKVNTQWTKTRSIRSPWCRSISTHSTAEQFIPTKLTFSAIITFLGAAQCYKTFPLKSGNFDRFGATCWDRCYDYKNIFSKKINENIGVFVSFYKNWIITLAFIRNTSICFAKKLSDIAKNCAHNIDPWKLALVADFFAVRCEEKFAYRKNN